MDGVEPGLAISQDGEAMGRRSPPGRSADSVVMMQSAADDSHFSL